jgi:hypothetical protein
MLDELKTKVEKPVIVKDAHLEYLDELRESGETNMFGARPYLMENFDLGRNEARTILSYWMASFGERHPKTNNKENK